MKTEITQKMKEAMKNKDSIALNTYRSMLTALTNNEKSKQNKTDLEIINTLAKQRQQAIDIYTEQGKTDLANTESIELKLIQEFLPKEMSEIEIETAINDIINSLPNKPTIKQLGQVIGMFKSKYEGQNISIVSNIIKNKLQ